MNDLRLALGSRIRDLRRRLGVSQEELASRAGMHVTYLSDLERGQQTPTLDMLNRLARALGVTLAEFFSSFTQPYRVRYASRVETCTVGPIADAGSHLRGTYDRRLNRSTLRRLSLATTSVDPLDTLRPWTSLS